MRERRQSQESRSPDTASGFRCAQETRKRKSPNPNRGRGRGRLQATRQRQRRNRMGLNGAESWSKLSAVHADAKKGWFIGLAIAGGCLAALVVSQVLTSAPKFQGKPMESWALQLVGRTAEGREEATRVIKSAGTNAVPEL